jgi:hypothetical protein
MSTDVHCRGSGIESTGAWAAVRSGRHARSWLLANLRNTSGVWSFDLRKLKLDEHERFVDSVTSGKDNMPSWYGILKDDEIEAIWSYIRGTVDR